MGTEPQRVLRLAEDRQQLLELLRRQSFCIDGQLLQIVFRRFDQAAQFLRRRDDRGDEQIPEMFHHVRAKRLEIMALIQ
jgi:hypothetical protein